MLFSRVVSLFTFFFAFGALALASPLEERQTAEVTSVFNQLKSTTDVIVPQLQALATDGSASDATVTPLINDLVGAFNTARSGLTVGSLGLAKREDALAALIAGIIEDVGGVLNTVSIDAAVAIPALSGLLVSVDVALQELLLEVDITVAGVLDDVSHLLVGVSGLLDGLSFGLVLGLLGL